MNLYKSPVKPIKAIHNKNVGHKESFDATDSKDEFTNELRKIQENGKQAKQVQSTKHVHSKVNGHHVRFDFSQNEIASTEPSESNDMVRRFSGVSDVHNGMVYLKMNTSVHCFSYLSINFGNLEQTPQKKSCLKMDSDSKSKSAQLPKGK